MKLRRTRSNRADSFVADETNHVRKVCFKSRKTLNEEEDIIAELIEAGKDNAQFLQLIGIVEIDSELRPLLLE